MLDLKQLQKEIYQNKIDKGFNISDVHLEFCYTYGELAEAFEAYRKKEDSVGEELADAMIFILGLCEILGIDMETELLKKVEHNKQREYKTVDGVLYRTKD